MEFSKTDGLFDVTKDGFHNALTLGIYPLAMRTVEFTTHGPELLVIGVERNTAAITTFCALLFQGATVKDAAAIQAQRLFVL